MKRLLYLMHLPWGWIKQRPHFIAENLANYFQVDLVYRFYKVPFEGRLVKNVTPTAVSLHPLVILPFNRFAPVAALNARIIRHYLKKTIAGYDAIWFTHPDMFEAVEPIIPKGTMVIYDCMDNHLGFDLVRHNPSWSGRILAAEKQLLSRSDVVITSSQALKEKLRGRYDFQGDIHVVNNGIHLEVESGGESLPQEVDAALTTGKFKLVYIGTIAPWLDMELLLRTVEAFPDVNVLLIGPSEVPLPKHLRIIHLGPLVHRQIYKVMEKADALIMPFIVNDLVLGVDPVKLYEYIYSGKPSIAVNYPETAKFGEFVYLYRNFAEFQSILRQLLKEPPSVKNTDSGCIAFARANTWEERVKQISSIVNELVGARGVSK